MPEYGTSTYDIKEEDELYRRIPLKNLDCWKDLNGEKVPSSFNFKTKPNEDGLSVDIAELTTHKLAILDKADYALSSFLAMIPINAGYICEHAPDLINQNEAHALIKGNTNKIAKKILAISVYGCH
ncbi:MAG: hypothetical protein JKY52_06305 [Flavobacteriales bacterium]|nr:hypothetical protein [Flavobacteriales bacterium]